MVTEALADLLNLVVNEHRGFLIGVPLGAALAGLLALIASGHKETPDEDSEFSFLNDDNEVGRMVVDGSDATIIKANHSACSYLADSKSSLEGSSLLNLRSPNAGVLEQACARARRDGQSECEFILNEDKSKTRRLHFRFNIRKHRNKEVFLVEIQDLAKKTRTMRQVATIRDLAIDLSVATDFEPALQAVLKALLEIGGLDAGAVMARRRTHSDIRVLAEVGFPHGLKNRVGTLPSLRAQVEHFFPSQPYFGNYQEFLDSLGAPKEARIEAQGFAILPLPERDDTEYSLHLFSLADRTLHRELRDDLVMVMARIHPSLMRLVESDAIRKKINSNQAVNHDKDALLANISHELRTPMNGILGTMDLLAASNLTETQKEYVDLVTQSSDAMLSVISDILDYSRIESNRLEIRPVDFSVANLVENVRALFAPRALEKRLELTLNVDRRIPAQIHSDPGRIRQVLINLIGNAIKFTPEGKVCIEAVCQSRVKDAITIRFGVRDTGMGIPRARLEKLLPSSESHASGFTERLAADRGTLGLTISQSLARLLGGEIWAESQESRGTVFWFSVKTSLARTNEQTLQEATNRSRPSRRALVTMEVQPERDTVIDLLTETGFDVDFAVSGKELSHVLNANFYDAIVIDLEIEQLKPYELVRLVRSQEASAESAKRIPVIAISPLSEEETRKRSLVAGIDEIVAKPLTTTALRHALERHMSVPPPNKNRVIDRSDLLARIGGSESIADEIIALFVSTMPEKIVEMRAAVKNDDIVALERLTHELKGAAGNVGAVGFLEAIVNMREHLRANARHHLITDLAQLQSEFDNVKAYCDEGLKKG